MIKFQTGNIFESSAKCLVNTVNCDGFMGKGIAYQFREKYPENNKQYVLACKQGKISIGKILLFEENEKIIANFPTKDKWREKSQYTYIESGLNTLVEEIKVHNITSIAIPPLGCGNGGLDWNTVKQMIVEKMSKLDINVFIFEPSLKFSSPKIEIPKMSASHLILMKLKSSLTSSQFNKLRLQKAAYFLNVFSGTNYFKFEEYKFGPYAHSIEILSQQIKLFQNSYNVTTVRAEEILYNNIISDTVKQTVEKYKYPILQASSFVNSVLSNHELEIVATVIAIIRQYPQFSDDDIVNYFLNNWPKYDKTRFSTEEIKLSILRLVKSNILKKELIGYSVTNETQTNKQLMPKYCY